MDIKVRELQRGLYRAAKANRKRIFYTLHDKICRRDVLHAAWQRGKANGGAPGIDSVSIEQIEEQGERFSTGITALTPLVQHIFKCIGQGMDEAYNRPMGMERPACAICG